MVEKKCKMCGGDLVLVEGRTIYECEYCGTKQIIPLSKEETEAEEKARALEEEKKRLERQKAEEEKRRLENEKLEAEQKRIEEQKRAEEEKKRIDEQKAEEARLRLEEEREKARLEEEKRRIEEQKREEERRRQKAESIGEEVTPEKKNKKMLLKIVLILFALCAVGAICAIAIDAQEKTKIAEKQRIEAEKKAEIAEQKRIEAEVQAKIEEEKRVLALEKKANMEQLQKEAEAREAEEERKAKEAEAKKVKSGGGTKIGSLYWSKRSSNDMNWQSAINYCQNLSEGGYSDWRLPTISELRTTIKNCSGSQSGGSCRVSDSCLSGNCWSKSCYCDDRSNNGGYYSKLGDPDGVWLWSSSTISDDTSRAWRVNFSSGYVRSHNKTYSGINVRCVR